MGEDFPPHASPVVAKHVLQAVKANTIVKKALKCLFVVEISGFRSSTAKSVTQYYLRKSTRFE